MSREDLVQGYSLVLLSKLENKLAASPSGEAISHSRIPVVDAVWAKDDPLPALVWYWLKIMRLCRKVIAKGKNSFHD